MSTPWIKPVCVTTSTSAVTVEPRLSLEFRDGQYSVVGIRWSAKAGSHAAGNGAGEAAK